MERKVSEIFLGYQAKKKFGQNFLKDKDCIHKIIQSIPNIHTDEQIVEIGAGLGDLSDELLKLYPIKAYEIDSDLCSLLRKKYHSALDSARLKLIHQDVLDLPNSKGWLHQEPYVLVSNLPYYVATHIILKILKDPLCQGFVVMTQKEVAQRFCAKSGKSHFCALSILTQTFGQVSYLFDVPAIAFEPVPRVTSAVFSFKKNIAMIDEDFENMLKIAFCAPRKKLLKNLATHYDKTVLQKVFMELRIPLDVRAHQLENSNYHQIFEKIRK